jgi:hypothetical protein
VSQKTVREFQKYNEQSLFDPPDRPLQQDIEELAARYPY